MSSTILFIVNYPFDFVKLKKNNQLTSLPNELGMVVAQNRELKNKKRIDIVQTNNFLQRIGNFEFQLPLGAPLYEKTIARFFFKSLVFLDLVDELLQEDDKNNDGYLSYAEYIFGRLKEDQNLPHKRGEYENRPHGVIF